MTDYSNYSSSQLHEQKQAFRDIINEQRENYRNMRRVGATDDARSISEHLNALYLNALYHDIEEINEELTSRREKREADRARREMRSERRKDRLG